MDNFDAGIFRFKLFDQFVDQIDFGLIEILPILNDNFFPIVSAPDEPSAGVELAGVCPQPPNNAVQRIAASNNAMILFMILPLFCSDIMYIFLCARRRNRNSMGGRHQRCTNGTAPFSTIG